MVNVCSISSSVFDSHCLGNKAAPKSGAAATAHFVSTVRGQQGKEIAYVSLCRHLTSPMSLMLCGWYQ